MPSSLDVPAIGPGPRDRLSTLEKRASEQSIRITHKSWAGNCAGQVDRCFQAEPGRRFTVKELAEIAFPGEPIEHKHEVSMGRVLRNLPGLKLHFQRTGESGTRGWRYLVWRQG